MKHLAITILFLLGSIAFANAQANSCDCSSMLAKDISKGIKMRSWKLECLTKDTTLTLNRDMNYEFVVVSSDSDVAVTVTNSSGNTFSNVENGNYYSSFSFACPKSIVYKINVSSSSKKKLSGCLGLYMLGRVTSKTN